MCLINSYKINQMIAITDYFYLFIISKWTIKNHDNKQLITLTVIILTVITLSGFHCTKTSLKLQASTRAIVKRWSTSSREDSWPVGPWNGRMDVPTKKPSSWSTAGDGCVHNLFMFPGLALVKFRGPQIICPKVW